MDVCIAGSLPRARESVDVNPFAHHDHAGGGGGKQGPATGALLTDRRVLPELVLGSVNIAGQQLHLALFGTEMHDGSECAMVCLQQVT